MFQHSLLGIEKEILRRSPSGLLYLGTKTILRREPNSKMEHLACFAGGMFAIYAQTALSDDSAHRWLNISMELAYTCRQMYERTVFGLGPETAMFEDSISDATGSQRDGYRQRPEAVETWFYLWRYTKEQKYRDWAWDFALSIERYTRVPHGYTGVNNLYRSKDDNISRDDQMQSFFLAETLKYLYLIFSNDTVVDLNQWVFTTEAHVLPVLRSD